MRKLDLVPTESSYSFEESAAEYLRVQLAGGLGRYRRDIIGASKIVNARWVLNRKRYEHLQMFYRVFCYRPEAFLLDLVIDGAELAECETMILPETFKTTEKSGGVFIVTAQLEVVPPYRDVVLESDILDMIQAFGDDWLLWADRLDILMNIKIPKIFESQSPLYRDIAAMERNFGPDWQLWALRLDTGMNETIPLILGSRAA